MTMLAVNAKSDREASQSCLPPEMVTLGEVMALLLARPGVPLEAASTFDLGYAGAEATVAVGLARLGHRTAYIGRLGDDALGRQVLRSLRGEGVQTDALRLDADAPTGLLVRDAPGDRPVTVLYHRSTSAARRLTPEDVPADLVRNARVLHLTGITAACSDSAHAAMLTAIEVARAAGVTICLDPNVRLSLAAPARWRGLLEELSPLVDVVMPGMDDARAVTDGDPAAWFLDRGVQTVVVKDGPHGAWETDGKRRWSQQVRPTTLVDPVGAGDAFAAGWLSALLRDRGPAERLHEAATIASFVVATHGDTLGLPTRATMNSVLQGEGDVQR